MEVKKMSKELEVNWKTKHKKFGEIHIKSINLDSNYMWTDNEECSCIGADSTLAKELFPTIPMLMNKELKQSLDELEELKKRDTPLKVVKRVYQEHNRYDCPNCDYYLGYIGTTITNTRILRENYCPNCGQRLDWSDEE